MTFWHGFKLLFKGKEARQYAVPLMKLSYNKSLYGKTGVRSNFKTLSDWQDYHSAHGRVYMEQDGHYCCEGCGCED